MTTPKGWYNIMIAELNNKIKVAMIAAYAHLGETDAEFVTEKIDNELDTLNSLMVGSIPDVIHTDVGDLTGYLVDIAIAADGDNVTALQLLVTDSDVHYIMNTYTLSNPESQNADDVVIVENEQNRVISLDSIDVSLFS